VPKQKTKLIIRKLPPTLPEQALKEAVADSLSRSNYFVYYPGKTRYARSLFLC